MYFIVKKFDERVLIFSNRPVNPSEVQTNNTVAKQDGTPPTAAVSPLEVPINNNINNPAPVSPTQTITPAQNQATPPQSISPQEDAQEKYLKQKHAMDFLLKVRMQYASTPQVYNEFLEIMKDFKSASYTNNFEWATHP